MAGLRLLDKCTLYAHNGGKFDFGYLIQYANTGTIIIRNGRITEMKIGDVTLKDSWPLMPFALAEYQKDKADYSLHKKDKRNLPKNKKKITEYVISDCRNLLELITGFHNIVGVKDTIGSAAFFQMKKLGIKIKELNESHDIQFREYFFGGRVEAVKKGIFDGEYKYYDINSAYPYAMLFKHPHGADYKFSRDRKKINGQCFINCRAKSRGAFPLRLFNKAGTPQGIDFPRDNIERQYFITGWEYLAAIETGTATITEIIEIWIPQTFVDLSEYVKTFFKKRFDAKNSGDKIGSLAYKYLLNSGYGKFAQNPRDFREYRIEEYGEECDGYEWEIDYGDISLWSKPSYTGRGFYDVATGASITGFQRAVLWRGACKAKNLLYMDTDALLCKSASLQFGDKLGEWKLEGVAQQCAIAGKKLYGVKWKNIEDGKDYKIASKGARLTYSEIVEVCNGGVVEWESQAPSYNAALGTRFVKRKIRRT